MEDATVSVPLLDLQAQANYLFPVAVVPDLVTGQSGLQTIVFSSPLCWLLYSLEKVLIVDFLPSAEAETTSDPESSCPVCQQNYFTTPSAAADTTTEIYHQDRIQTRGP